MDSETEAFEKAEAGNTINIAGAFICHMGRRLLKLFFVALLRKRCCGQNNFDVFPAKRKWSIRVDETLKGALCAGGRIK